MSAADLDLYELTQSLPKEPRAAMFAANEAIQKRASQAGVNVKETLKLFHYLKTLYLKNGYTWAPNVSNPSDLLEMLTIEIDSLHSEHLVNDFFAEIEGEPAQKFGRAEFSPEEKKKLREKISSLKEIIDTAGLAERKKNAIFRRLNDLEKEIELHSTSTDRFFGLLGDISMVCGEMAENASPAIEQAREILRIVMKSRARAEGAVLPKGENSLHLPDFSADESEVENE